MFGISVKFLKINGQTLIHENLQTKQKIDFKLNKTCPPWAATNPDWIPDCRENNFLINLSISQNLI